jgi:hypothetical protein
MGKFITGIAVAVAVIAGIAPPTAAQEATDGLRVEAATTYLVDGSAQVIRVSTEMTLTNQLPNNTQYFYAYGVPVLAGSTGHRAFRADGGSLSVSVEADDDPASGFSYAEVRLRPNLFPGQSLSFRLDYELPFLAPRAPGWSRGNAAVVTFPAIAAGDPGLGSLEVRVPDDYDVEVGGAELDRETADGHVVLQADTIDDPWMFTPVIVATRDDELLEREAEVDGRSVTLQAWPNDTAWADYMAKQLDLTMPALEGLVGQPWPDDLDGLKIVESSTPAAHGYAGWYDPTENSITLGDAFDPMTVAHELAHVWFNDTLFRSRWVNEGFADEYAQTTLEQLKLPSQGAVAPDPAAPGAVALNDWNDSWSYVDVDHATEDYAYNASWYVIDQVMAEIGVEKMRAVVDVAADRRIAYAGDPERESFTLAAGWQILLDLLENEARSTKALGLFDRFVVTDEQRAALQARTAARLAYAGLVERGGAWTPPFALRKAMGEWKFDKVEDAIADADQILELRADIETTLDGLDVGDLGLEDTYEQAPNLDVAVEEAEDTLDAARAYRDTRADYDEESGNLLARVGLFGSDTESRLDDAAADLADANPGGSLAATGAVDRHLDTAVRNGLLRLAALLFTVFVLAVLLVWRPRARRRRTRRRDDEVATLEAMYAAPEALEYPTAPPTADPAPD